MQLLSVRIAANGLLLLACAYTLYFASAILIPFTLSLFLALTLTPFVRGLEGVRIPRPVGAGIVVLTLVAGIAGGVNLLWEPAGEWLAAAPERMSVLESRLRELRTPLQEIQDASEDIARAADVERKENQVWVEAEGQTLLETAAARSPEVAATFLAILFLLYFLLGYGDRVINKVAHLSAPGASRASAVAISVAVQRQISRFLLVITSINCALATLVALGLYWVGFPNPLLWGVVTGVLNYAPYVGSAIAAVLLTVVGLLSLDSMALALAVPAGFLVLTAVEGQVLTPTLLGRHMALSPYMVFLAITFWGWLWGIAGVLIAVPMLAITRILAESLPGLGWLALLLGREGDLAPADHKAAGQEAPGAGGRVPRGETLQRSGAPSAGPPDTVDPFTIP